MNENRLRFSAEAVSYINSVLEYISGERQLTFDCRVKRVGATPTLRIFKNKILHKGV